MNRLLLYIIALIACTLSACIKDDVDSVDEIQSVETEYGDSLSFSVAADLSSMPDGSSLPEGVVTIVASSASEGMERIEAEHRVVDGVSTFTLTEPLTIGRHAIHWINYTTTKSTTKSTTDSFMLGLSLDVESTGNTTPSTYNVATRSVGSGTKSDPIEVASPVTLQMINNNLDSGALTDTYGIYYKQVCDLNFFPYTITYGGFDGVCPDSNRPFRGVYDGAGYSIKFLTMARLSENNIDSGGDTSTTPAALFCHISGASIKNVNIEQPYIVGYNWVGSLVGAVVCKTSLDMTFSFIDNCHLVDATYDVVTSKIYGVSYVGGLVGGVDYFSSLVMTDCSVDVTSGTTTISTRNRAAGGACCGGLIGGGFIGTQIFLHNGSNNLPITSYAKNSVGGLIGGGYKVMISNCLNSGDVTSYYNNGSTSDNTFGTGGIIGGAMEFVASGLKNTGDVEGGNQTGGIIGSTSIGYNDGAYGDIQMVSAINNGDVKGIFRVGGIVGCGQISLTDAINTGHIEVANGESSTSDDDDQIESRTPFTGGIAGYAPVAVLSNCNNTGYIDGRGVSGGIVGFSFYPTISASNNAGNVYSSMSDERGSTGGIIGRMGYMGTIDFCNNYGTIEGQYDPGDTIFANKQICYVGGIIGTVGLDMEQDHSTITTKLIEEATTTGFNILAEILEGAGHHFGNEITAFIGEVACGFGLLLETSLTIYHTYEGVTECLELQEEADEFGEELEEISSDILPRAESYSSEINEAIAKEVSYASYYGDVPISSLSSFNPMVLSYQNSAALCDYLAQSEERYAEYNENSRAELTDIGEANLQQDRITEAVFVALECIVGVASIVCGGIGFFTEGIITAAAGIAIDLGLGATEGLLTEASLWAKDTNNCIAITQNANYGSVKGHGIAGYTNDNVRILYCHSAAATTNGYTVTNYKQDGMDVEYNIASGEPTANAYSDSDYVAAITRHNTNIDFNQSSFNSYDDYADPDNYPIVHDPYDIWDEDYAYNNLIGRDFFDSGYWVLKSGYAFPIINNSRYMNEWGGNQ